MRENRGKRAEKVAACLLALASALVEARASAASDPVAADARFEEARELMARGEYELACRKFEESRDLDPGIGTLFNLALCYEATGRLATAWTTYRDVVAATQAANQPERERIAQARARVLEPRLSYLTVVVAPSATGAERGAGVNEETHGLVVYRDDLVVEPALWGLPVAIDPGAHEIVAKMAGHKTFHTTVPAPREGQRVDVAIPELPLEDEQPQTAAASPAHRDVLGARFSASSATPQERHATLPIVVGATGLVSLGIGAYFGFRSVSQHGEADSHCNGNVCDKAGFDLRESAGTSGNVSTVLIGIGATTMVAALGLWLFLPSKRPQGGRPPLGVAALTW